MVPETGSWCGRFDIGGIAGSPSVLPGLLGLDQAADLDQVVGEHPVAAPDPGAVDAVHQGAVPAVAVLEVADAPSEPVRHLTSRRNPRVCSWVRRVAPGWPLRGIAPPPPPRGGGWRAMAVLPY